MNPNAHPPRADKNRRSAAVAWRARRRRTALTQVMRGACYGIGTGAVGLAFVWAQQHLL
ncbi:hypothetical protein ABZT04_43585 [Streptomyces sp. NPDC005492]|uniref:hypothetical protein n=1 Tax=Streptomyces sp. NPDC005492 TaxID=3156883 RepID=UPI0033AB3764